LYSNQDKYRFYFEQHKERMKRKTAAIKKHFSALIKITTLPTEEIIYDTKVISKINFFWKEVKKISSHSFLE